MDHSYIEEHVVIDRYIAGKLSSMEWVNFEEHFMNCPECRRQLDAAEEFDRAFKRAASQVFAKRPR